MDLFDRLYRHAYDFTLKLENKENSLQELIDKKRKKKAFLNQSEETSNFYYGSYFLDFYLVKRNGP